MVELSVLIPARNEIWVNKTVEDVLAHSSDRTEVIVVLDGAWPETPLPQHPRLHVVHVPAPIGQRAAVNLAARLTDATYVMKLDAHCAVAPGFDTELLRSAAILPRETIQIPAQHNLHVFDWQCDGCKKRTYQGPTPTECDHCHGTAFRKVITWERRPRVRTTAWYFDRDLKFQYWGEYTSRPEGKGEITPTLSCLGACWFLARDWFWNLGGLDEAHGSWGQMGTELACKAWLSGGQMLCNQRTWFAHMFRTQGGDFGFPYEIHGSEQDRARRYSRELWLTESWPKATRTLRDLIAQFAPVPTWDKAPAMHTKPTSGVIYYSDNRPDADLLEICRHQLELAAKGLPIVSCTLKPTPLGHNIVLDRERGYLTMALQILTALEALDTDIAFHAEHDVLYHPSHFACTPAPGPVYTYNQHTWKVDAASGRAITYRCNQLSGLLAPRQFLINHFTARVQRIAAVGYSMRMGFEPGTHHRPERLDSYGHAVVRSESPNIDLRHRYNLTPTRWSPTQFRSPRNCRDWIESDAVPGWGVTSGRMPAFLAALAPRPSLIGA